MNTTHYLSLVESYQAQLDLLSYSHFSFCIITAILFAVLYSLNTPLIVFIILILPVAIIVGYFIYLRRELFKNQSEAKFALAVYRIRTAINRIDPNERSHIAEQILYWLPK